MNPLSIALTLFFAITLSGCKTPKTSFTTKKASVIKVYHTSDSGHNFIAYVVDRAGTEIIVSDTLGKSSYKVGDTIEYIDQKIAVDSSTRTLSFSLLD
jgi:hypothetical protein